MKAKKRRQEREEKLKRNLLQSQNQQPPILNLQNSNRSSIAEINLNIPNNNTNNSSNKINKPPPKEPLIQFSNVRPSKYPRRSMLVGHTMMTATLSKKNRTSALNPVSPSIDLPPAQSKEEELISDNTQTFIPKDKINHFLEKTPARKPTDKEKLQVLNSMVKMFKLDVTAENIHIDEGDLYTKSRKEVLALQEAIKVEEKELNELMKHVRNETQKYVQKVMELQNELYNSPNGDIVSLEEANRVDNVLIQNLIANLRSVNEDYERDIMEIRTITKKQIEPIQKELKAEINAVQLLKKELMKFKGGNIPQEIKKKLEIVMKYKTQV